MFLFASLCLSGVCFSLGEFFDQRPLLCIWWQCAVMVRILGNNLFFSPPPCRVVRNSTVVFGRQDDNGVIQVSFLPPVILIFPVIQRQPQSIPQQLVVTRASEILTVSVWRSKPMSTCGTLAAIFWSGAQVTEQMKVPARVFFVLF